MTIFTRKVLRIWMYFLVTQMCPFGNSYHVFFFFECFLNKSRSKIHCKNWRWSKMNFVDFGSIVLNFTRLYRYLRKGLIQSLEKIQWFLLRKWSLNTPVNILVKTFISSPPPQFSHFLIFPCFRNRLCLSCCCLNM